MKPQGVRMTDSAVQQRPSSGTENAASMTRSAFETATAAFHQALRTNDAETLFMHVAEDVVIMPPGEGAVRGKSAMPIGTADSSLSSARHR